MKKNNKFRNSNYNNQILSLNYRFDSVSSAGKCSGTALDLIKRYNELAKEAQGNANYVEAEVFRQYAEHYRKIVTEINERKSQQQVRSNNVEENESVSETPASVAEVETTAENEAPAVVAAPVKREFKVIEISSQDAGETVAPIEKTKQSRPRGRRKTEAAAL